MNENTLTLIAQRAEHCIACYRLIHPGETYHQTAENTVLCQGCADFETLDTIQATDDLAVGAGDGPNLWEVRELPGGVALELRAGDDPALALVQGENRVRVELAHVRELVAALVDAAADLAGVLAAGGVYHA
jgi:hypothetical protein